MELESHTANTDDVFPLPLAPFEAYMLADHRDEYPMHFYFQMEMQGRLQLDSLRTALTDSIEHHPLLRAKVRPRFGRVPAWEPGGDVCIRICRQGFANLNEILQAPRIDLMVESGLRTWVFEGLSGAELLFEFHHSCCDGLGALILIEDVLVNYHRIMGGKEMTREPADPDGLRTRTTIPLTPGQAVRKIPLDVQDAFRILLRRPAIAKAPGTPEENDVDRGLSDFLSHQFSPVELNGLISEARAHSTTLNCILMKDVYRSLDQWMTDCGDTGHRWIRMGVPASTRAGHSSERTCCNRVTIMFLDQHSNAIRNADQLLDRVTTLTQFHRASNIWYSMLQLLDILAAVPPLLRLYLRTNRRMCTTITSNVGRAFEACPLPQTEGRMVVGDMQLTSLNFLSPLRPGTDVTFGVVTYADTLSLSMHYKPHRIGRTQAHRLLDRVVENLRESARSGTSRPQTD
ncbi:MAG: DUF1298 domain-containing protein [Fuerstiella sp.]|nr:DUF1298 domain-containing protein [Fuerstiella sp.]MCP4509061.1 DUF1298 domain-containing protein [Fuerstiella sp.]